MGVSVVREPEPAPRPVTRSSDRQPSQMTTAGAALPRRDPPAWRAKPAQMRPDSPGERACQPKVPFSIYQEGASDFVGPFLSLLIVSVSIFLLLPPLLSSFFSTFHSEHSSSARRAA